jgi:FKBP-type peptidyl-prolyl cis-trans isomerase FkpA
MTLFLLVVLTLPVMRVKAAEQELKLETEGQKLSYALGMDIGDMIKHLGTDANVDLAIVMRAVQDSLAGKDLLLTTPQANEIKQAFLQKLQERLVAARKAQGEKNRTDSEAFLAQNKTKPGVVTTASGLQYEVITQGNGEKPTDTDTVIANYRGTLLDGTEFDSSYKRGKPATLPVKGVIPGWTEALQLMPVGSKYRLFIPANLAYGERGAGKLIGPNATLVFEVELLEINKPQPVPKITVEPPATPKPGVEPPTRAEPQANPKPEVLPAPVPK